MNNLESVVLKNKEIYQQELDAIDKKYGSESATIGEKKNKFIEKLMLYKKWLTDLYQAASETDNNLRRMRNMIDVSKKNLRKFGKDLQQLGNDVELMRNDDSGIGEMLTATDQVDGGNDPDQIDIERRIDELTESIGNLSHDLDQISEEITKLEKLKTDIFAQYDELQQKYDHLQAEMQQELNID